MPRLAVASMTWNSRLMIWELSLASIPDSFIFGRGFYSYRLISYAPEFVNLPEVYPAYHAHNLVIEFLLSFGIVGTIIFLAFIFVIFQKVFISRQLLKKSQISILIIAVTAGVLMHSILDMTMLWIQPMILYCVIFGGIGANEKVISGMFQNIKKT
jgi:O-antigen ligase